MIVREQTTSGGALWWIVRQRDHARLAAALARSARSAGVRLPAWNGQWLQAVSGHDEGWVAADSQPSLHKGRPLSFHELPIEQSIGIWSGSIAASFLWSPICGAWVAEHFLRLLHRFHDRPWSAPVCRFADRFARLRDVWIAGNQRPVFDVQVDWLQAFDRLSLMLCGAAAGERVSVPMPEGPAADVCLSHVRWGAGQGRLRSAIPVYCVPAARYTSGDELFRAARTGQIPWRWATMRRSDP